MNFERQKVCAPKRHTVENLWNSHFWITFPSEISWKTCQLLRNKIDFLLAKQTILNFIVSKRKIMVHVNAIMWKTKNIKFYYGKCYRGKSTRSIHGHIIFENNKNFVSCTLGFDFFLDFWKFAQNCRNFFPIRFSARWMCHMCAHQNIHSWRTIGSNAMHFHQKKFFFDYFKIVGLMI